MHHSPSASSAILLIALFLFIFTAAADDRSPSVIDSSVIDSTSEGISTTRFSILPGCLHDSSIAAQQSSIKAVFVRLGEFHRLKGIYVLLAGTFGICAGVVLLDKADSVPLAITCMSLGGVSIGLGLWEIKIGTSLLRNQSQFP